MCLLPGVLAGCGSGTVPEPAAAGEEPQLSADQPSIEYDVKTRTMRVLGVTDFAALAFPDEIQSARVLEIPGEAFSFSAYLDMTRQLGLDEQTQLPALIGRTADSIRFLQEYLRDNAGAAYPSALAELPVVVRMDNLFEYEVADDRIVLKYNELGTHREFLYLLALMEGEALGWEHLGYAWYVGTCIDPYSEVIDEWPIVPELPYYTQCIAGGVDPAHMTAADFRTVYDACARVCFEKGLTHWGSYCESLPVTAEPDYSRAANKQEGDTLLTAFTAASFLAWLDESYGFEQVSLFCFGQKSFEEAFGTDFRSAYSAWKVWILHTYPAS